MCEKIKIPLRKSKNDQKNFPLARKRAREQKLPHPQTAYNLRKNGARHPLNVQSGFAVRRFYISPPSATKSRSGRGGAVRDHDRSPLLC